MEPLAMMLVLWLIFTYFRSGRQMDVPFSAYLLTGLIAYDFFNKGINISTRSIKSFSFILKKVNFRVALLPLVKISSEILIHSIVVVIVCIIIMVTGIKPSFYWFQVLYYLFAASIMLIGLAWFTSSIVLFFPDIQFVITITMRLLFFFTPIFWSLDMIPEEYAIYFKINPLYFVVSGYRDSLLYGIPFWERVNENIFFWGLTAIFMIIGVFTFKRLRPHFADVL
jgi:lipopolysaccharide transport system permease protein/teichoic acid transport system permease protein